MAEYAQGVTVGPGDILLVAWGREARRAATRGFDGFSGLHAECLPWLQEREVAVLGSDGISDPMPFVGTPEWPFPVHQIGITAMGLHLIDNVALARWPSGARPPGGGSSCSPWARCASPGAPGARSTRWPCCERRTTSSGPWSSATPGPSTGATSRRWPACSVPTRPSSGPGAPSPSRSGWRPCGARGPFPTSMHVLGDPLIALGRGRDRARLDTYAVVYQLSEPGSGGGDLTLGINYLDDVVRDGRSLADRPPGVPHPLDAVGR